MPFRESRPRRLPLLKRLLGKKTARDSAPAIQRFFADKARQQGYTLSPSQVQVIDAMARQAAHLLAQRPTRSLYLHGAVAPGQKLAAGRVFPGPAPA